jgi:hypothetical protein
MDGLETSLTDIELAIYLRDALGSAEVVEWATQIPSDHVHLVAQGLGQVSDIQSKALRLLYGCCMYAPLDDGESLRDWLGRPVVGSVSPVALIWAGDEVAIADLLV